MTDPIIASDAALSRDERQLLAGIADTLLPATADGRMPSAATVDVAGYLNADGAASLPSVRTLLADLPAAMITAGVTSGAGLDNAGQDFSGLSAAAREAALAAGAQLQPAAFAEVLRVVYACYYRDPRVLTGIGVAAGPPFPRGNQIEAGDLALLDAVVRRGRTWRS